MKSIRPALLWSLSLAAVVLVMVAASAPLQVAAEEAGEAALRRALTTYALARGLNGLISVAQGTEVAIEPAGVGVTLAAGEVLDPLNDLVERFSWLILLAATSLGLQQILLGISQWWPLTAGLLVALAALVFVVWRGQGGALRRRLTRLVTLLLVVRFAVPLMLLGAQATHQIFLAEDYRQATEAITLTSRALEDRAAEAQAEPASGVEGLRRWWSDRARALDVRGQMGELKQNLEQAVADVLRLAAQFVFETVVLPVFFLWLFARLVRHAFD